MTSSSCVTSIISPRLLRNVHSLEDEAFVTHSRKKIEDILLGKDDRFLLVMGPCSIHDEEATFDFANKLKLLQERYSSLFCIVMRCYLEKSRSSCNWKGFLSSPNITKNNVVEGLERGRALLAKIVNLGLPIAYEIIDPLVVPYFEDVISYASIGARSVRSQVYRYIASSVGFPVAFKNTLEGNVQVPIDSILCTRTKNSFLSINDDGKVVSVEGNGNKNAHLVLRGFINGDESHSNYDDRTLQRVNTLLKEKGLKPCVIIDCSHDNSHKNPACQETVFLEMLKKRYEGEKPFSMIRGVMLESFIEEGAISVEEYLKSKRYGISITDPCMGWERTERLLEKAFAMYSHFVKTAPIELSNASISKKDDNVELHSIKRQKNIQKREIEIYTDGACSGNPGKGGWGFVIVENGKVLEKKSGGSKATTNNRMEMQAVIEALKNLNEFASCDEACTIYTDSVYVKNGITQWIKKWKDNGWKSSSKSPVKNQDLWVLLDSLVTNFNLTWKWVKGHAGNVFNEMCDGMATEASKQ